MGGVFSCCRKPQVHPHERIPLTKQETVMGLLLDHLSKGNSLDVVFFEENRPVLQSNNMFKLSGRLYDRNNSDFISITAPSLNSTFKESGLSGTFNIRYFPESKNCSIKGKIREHNEGNSSEPVDIDFDTQEPTISQIPAIDRKYSLRAYSFKLITNEKLAGNQNITKEIKPDTLTLLEQAWVYR